MAEETMANGCLKELHPSKQSVRVLRPPECILLHQPPSGEPLDDLGLLGVGSLRVVVERGTALLGGIDTRAAEFADQRALTSG